jgi:hypothetical protein
MNILKKIFKFIVALPLIYVAGFFTLIGLYVTVMLGAGVVGYAYESDFGGNKDQLLKTHITIYVDNPVLLDGGIVLVAGIPINEKKWRVLENTNNIAMLDPGNPKTKDVKVGDKHFGVVVSSVASAVEFYYPENGSYTYNFLLNPRTLIKSNQLQTKVLSTGSRQQLPDPETGKLIDWPSENTVAIIGKKNNDVWVRCAEANFFNADEKESKEVYKINKSSGLRVIEITPKGIEKYFNKSDC